MYLRTFITCCTLGGVLMGWALPVHALTLGNVRGTAELGRVLNVTIPLQIAPDEDVSGACFLAEASYGDNPLDPHRVHTQVVHSASGIPQAVRVHSSVAIDEPVVSLSLRVSCGFKTRRSFTLLVELPQEAPNTAASVVPADVPVVEAPAPKREPVAVDSLASGADVAQLVAQPPKKKIRARASAAVAQSSSHLVVRKPRLRVEAWDDSLAYDPELKLTSNLLALPTSDLQKREEAAAAWRALNASAQDVLRDAARLQAMERDLQQLHSQLGKNQTMLAALEARLDQAQTLRSINLVVLGLCVALVAFLVWRFGLRKGKDASAPWWGNNAPPPEDVAPIPMVATVLPEAPDAVDEEDHITTVVPLDPPQEPPVPAITRGAVEFSHSGFSNSRALSMQEMLDAQQQADFFMTLGEYDEAIRILQECIHEHTQANPLVYLDLLSVFHMLGRDREYEHYRQQFVAIFNARLPAFAEFNVLGLGLEAYPRVAERITQLWPTKDVVAFIEASLTRLPADGVASSGAIEFELEAFRELLLLHGILQQLSCVTGVAVLPFSVNAAPAEPRG